MHACIYYDLLQKMIIYNDFCSPRFNPTTVINLLAKERGYKVMYPPQQRSIPLKPGSTDDK